MITIRLLDTATSTVLASRPAARAFSGQINTVFEARPQSVTFDFDGIRVVAPSFLDELLLQTEKALDGAHMPTIIIRSYPPGLEANLEAVGRAHDTEVVLDDLGSWVLTRMA